MTRVERRGFLMGTLGLLAAPLAAEAQQARVYRVGVVLHGSPYYSAIDGLRDGLRELGFEEGKQSLSVRDTKGDLKSADALARESRRGECRPDLCGDHLGHGRGQAGD